jgi:hypothetical protein
LLDGSGILAASAGDGAVYQYAEGMMAPIGSFSNYRRAAMAIDLLDLAPRMVAPGDYEVPVRYERGGGHVLVVSGVAPRLAACARLDLPSPLRKEAATVTETRVQLLALEAAQDGTRVNVQVALQRVAGDQVQALTGVRDVRLLAFQRQSGWQRRIALRPLGDHYAGDLEWPDRQALDLMVESASQRLDFLDGRLGLHGAVIVGGRIP